MVIDFMPLKEKHLLLLHQWFQEPVIKKQYARNLNFSLKDIQTKYLPRIQGKDSTPSYIIQLDHQPLGFIQYYRLSDHFPSGISNAHHPLFKIEKAEKSCGIDFFIADSNYRGKGLGQRILLQFIEKFLSKPFSHLIVDPSIDNKNAIKCYLKCGFLKSDISEDAQHILMIKEIKHN